MGFAFNTSHALSEIARAAQRLSFTDAAEYDPLIAAIGDARLVLIGEASHGTHDFYRERARITRRLIEEKGFSAVAIEGDWPDAHRVNRFVTGWSVGISGAREPIDALSGFRRFPAWMWRNMDVLAFVEWLQGHNMRKGTSVGFFGLDLTVSTPLHKRFSGISMGMTPMPQRERASGTAASISLAKIRRLTDIPRGLG